MASDGHQTIQDILVARGFVQPLAKLSATDPDSNGAIQYVIPPESPAGQLKAIDFDAVKNAWYQDKAKFVFLPKSADALIVDGDEFFFVEFKTGKIVMADSLRKAYDSTIALVEFGGFSWEICKQHLKFLLVGTEAVHLQWRKKAPGEYMARNYKGADSDPRTVSGQIVKEFRVFTPEEFEAFVGGRNWTRAKGASLTTEQGAAANQ